MELELWWTSSLQPIPKDQRRHVAALLMYTTWNIWKERNKRVFEGKTMTTPLVFNCILEEIGLRQAALRVSSVALFVMLSFFHVEFECSSFYVISL